MRAPPRRTLPSLLGGTAFARWRSRRAPTRTASSARPTCRSRSGCSAGPPRSCWSSPSSRSPRCGARLSCRSHRAQRLDQPFQRPLGLAREPARPGLFALVLYSGFDGAQVANANFSVTFIYVIFWVGLPVASVLFGDVFAALSPWRDMRAHASTLACAAARSRGAAAPLPGSPGHLARARRDRRLRLARARLPRTRRPSTLAALSLGYFLVMLTGMAAVRRRGVGGPGRRLRRLLQPALPALSARARRATARCACAARSAASRALTHARRDGRASSAR